MPKVDIIAGPPLLAKDLPAQDAHIAGVTAGLVGVGVGTGYLLWGRGRKSK